MYCASPQSNYLFTANLSRQQMSIRKTVLLP
uniref:Uncharacterized protein n=1 Tax=Anguilla anguilla TaxID=7936 RepID=A0A0E9T802_ANGAN